MNDIWLVDGAIAAATATTAEDKGGVIGGAMFHD
jgi:hypothetical protein